MRRQPHPSPAPAPKNTPKAKNKTKARSRDKKFNPLDYLNSLLVEIHEPAPQTARKRHPSTAAKRELHSALGYVTPHTERNPLSAGKPRARSAHGHRRRSTTIKEILKEDLEKAMGEEEESLIHFTEETAQSGQSQAKELPVLAKRRGGLGENAAARRIQRAWRNYQTRKVVSKYYVYYKHQMKQQDSATHALHQMAAQGDWDRQSSSLGRKDFERTLKIRQQHCNLPEKPPSNKDAEHFRSLSSMSQNTTKELIREPMSPYLGQSKTLELPTFSREPQPSSEYPSKDIRFLMELFRSSQEMASREIDSQFEAYCRVQADLAPASSSELESCGSAEQISSGSAGREAEWEQLSPAIFVEMEKTMRDKCHVLLEKVSKQLTGGQLTEWEAQHRFDQLSGRLARELRDLQRCRRDYEGSLRQLKESMLRLQADASLIERTAQAMGRASGSPARVRKCYSSDTLILKSILADVTHKNVDIEEAAGQVRPQLFTEGANIRLGGMGQRRMEELPQIVICPTSPPSVLPPLTPSQPPRTAPQNSLSLQEVSPTEKMREQLYNTSNFTDSLSNQHSGAKELSSSELSVPCDLAESVSLGSEREDSREDSSVMLLRECAEEMQERIEGYLLAELMEDVYSSDRLFQGLKPYIEKPFQFRQVTDAEIRHFLREELPRYFLPEEQLLARLNQKINPNSAEILRLIRDFDFEIEEYELVLPEEVFKGYRRSVEQQYARLIGEQSGEVGAEQWAGVAASEGLREMVGQRQAERAARQGKFLSFERDLRIMYMKSVFNCLNEMVIEVKSFYTFMNGRSSIGPGELTLAIRDFNASAAPQQCRQMLEEAKDRVEGAVGLKCMLPVFKNYRELESFQGQMGRQIKAELQEGEYKWVNYMDEVLEIWQEVSVGVADQLMAELVLDLADLLL